MFMGNPVIFKPPKLGVLLHQPPAMQSLVDDAVAKGARVVNALGQMVEATFMRPTVVYPVSSEARLYQEEQFGLRAAGQHLRHRPPRDRCAGRSACQSGVSGKHQ